MIEIRSVSKSFGPRTALTDVSLSVEPGERVALVGPNGAGKTTLLRILATLTRATSGTIRIAGLDPARAGDEVRHRIGFLSHHTLLYDDLTANQNLRFCARMYGLSNAPARIEVLLKLAGLSTLKHDLVRTFSQGMKQRLAVVRAVLHRPRLLLLDEPYTGLDIRAAQVVSDLLAEMTDDGCTTMMATHNLPRALAAGQRVIVLDRGRVVRDVQSDTVDAATFPEAYRAMTA
jgi:heme ABC exporter ATP-binding subunit CcmA